LRNADEKSARKKLPKKQKMTSLRDSSASIKAETLEQSSLFSEPSPTYSTFLGGVGKNGLFQFQFLPTFFFCFQTKQIAFE
jgi:hypothetical protein